jgi:hypothetical protein
MFCAPGLYFGGTEGVGFRFHVLRTRTSFRRYRRRRVLFFMFCALGPIFDGTDCVGSRFHVSRTRTRFRRYRRRLVPLSFFAPPDPFLTVPKALVRILMFCAPRLDFGGTEGVRFCFHVLRSRTRFRRYRGRQVPFSCFTILDSISAVPRASGSVFKFCAPGLIFGDNEGVISRFYVLRSRTHFRRNRGRRVPFSCFALPDSVSAVPRASGPVF